MHKLLLRQLKRHGLSSESIPLEWKNFFQDVSEAYGQQEKEVQLIERTLSLSSEELGNANSSLFSQIEQIKTLNKQLVETQQQLLMSENMLQHQKMESIGQLAGGIAHDFNNLLASIIGFASLLLQKEEISPKIKHAAASIKTSAEHGAELTKKLLGFARKGKIKRSEFDLNQSVLESTEMLERSLSKEVSIVTNLSESPILLSGDPTQIFQVLMNLGINAGDAMHQSGTLTITTQIREINDLEFPEFFSKKPENPIPWAILKVADTGEGIKPEIMKKIFEPFFTTKSVGKGTGLGLAMIHGIVDRHDGFIKVESTLGEGACFSVFLPALGNGHEKKSLSTDLPKDESLKNKKPDLKKHKILVVDDEMMVRELVIDILTELGAECISAQNGREAIEIYKQNNSDIRLIISDIMMPEMNGIEAFKEMSKIKPPKDIIFISGFHENKELEEVLNKNPKHAFFLSKPFQLEGLYEVLRKIVFH